MSAVLKPRCIQCHKPAHPPGCAYQVFGDANLGVVFRCPKCSGTAFQRSSQSTDHDRLGTAAVLVCGGCRKRWEITVCAEEVAA